MASRKIGDLSPRMQVLYNKFHDRCRRDTWFLKNGIEVLLTCTFRSGEEQNKLYAQGRTAPGRRVTNAKAGKSKHNTVDARGKPASDAFDVVPLRHGRCIWGTNGDGIDQDPTDDDTDDLEAWDRVGEHGVAAGLEWGGNWTSFKDRPHFQDPGV
jgi:peptidoglycan L-alanyl-D-glutamate endopeptidase CwlK